ncbi:hypothetical protein Tco_1010335, partial [Tanacetum coccineum]
MHTQTPPNLFKLLVDTSIHWKACSFEGVRCKTEGDMWILVLVEKVGLPAGLGSGSSTGYSDLMGMSLAIYFSSFFTHRAKFAHMLLCDMHFVLSRGVKTKSIIATLKFDRDRKSMGVIVKSKSGRNSLIVKKMLHLDPIKRILAKAALEHEYFKDVGHVPIENFEELATVGYTFLDSFRCQGLEFICRPSIKNKSELFEKVIKANNTHRMQSYVKDGYAHISIRAENLNKFKDSCVKSVQANYFSMHKFGEVDPIVASFSGGAVGVISAFIVVEILKQQEHKRCKYCLGT